MRIAVILLALALPIAADEIRLRSGGVIQGRIVAESADEVTLELPGGGTMTVRQADIASLTRGPSPQDEFERRLAQAESSGDINELYAVGLWAREHGMGRQARGVFERVIAADPNHEGARRALGFVLHEGQWMTQEEAYRAMGLVERNGRWLTEAEAMLIEERELERERRRTELALERERRHTEALAAYRQTLEDWMWEQRRRYDPPRTYTETTYVYPVPYYSAPTVIYYPQYRQTPAYYGGFAYHFHARIGGERFHFFSPGYGSQHGLNPYSYWW